MIGRMMIEHVARKFAPAFCKTKRLILRGKRYAFAPQDEVFRMIGPEVIAE